MEIKGASADLRVGVTSRGESPFSEVCERFGRSYSLMIYSSAEGRWFAIDNSQNRTRVSGAGVATAETMIAAGVTVVLTGETGPKAFRTLQAAGISVAHNVNGTVEEALNHWLAGHLVLALAANDAGSPDCLLGRHLSHVEDEAR